MALTISVITIIMSAPNTPIKKQTFSDWIFKKNILFC